jgi:hypothetical protein
VGEGLALGDGVGVAVGEGRARVGVGEAVGGATVGVGEGAVTGVHAPPTTMATPRMTADGRTKRPDNVRQSD